MMQLLEFDPQSLFKAIELINAGWKQSGGTQQFIDQAATALTGLSFQVADRAGTADELFLSRSRLQFFQSVMKQ